MSVKNVPPYTAHFDGNQVPSLTAVEGTLGTTDTGGTARVIPVGANPATGALFVQDLAGAAGTTNVQGSVTVIGGTVQNIASGSVVVTTGTVNNGTFVMPSGTLTTGSITNVANLLNGTVVVPSGTITTGSLTNIANLLNGTVVVPTGTITTGSLTNLANLYNGSINILTGTLQASGTTTGVGVVSNLTNGSVNILTGTLQSAGTTTGVGVVSNLTNGSVNLLTGTVTTIVAGTQNTLGTVGTVNGIEKQDLDLGAGAASRESRGVVLANFTTPTFLADHTAYGDDMTANIAAVGVRLYDGADFDRWRGDAANGADVDVTRLPSDGTIVRLTSAGTIAGFNTGTVTTGSLTDVAKLYTGTINVGTFVHPSGTITTIAAGTQNTLGTVGVLNDGTAHIDPRPAAIAPLIQGTLGTAGGSFFATLSAASGAGTKHYITGLSVVGQSGTADVRILAGTAIQGTGVLGAGNVVPGGGYVRDFMIPFATGTNSELTYHFVGAGTAFIVVNYFKAA